MVDECVGPLVARWLRGEHEVFSVFEEAKGLDDDNILQRAREENRILITNDKDFGEMVFREGKAHQGVVLLRLDDERPQNQIAVLQKLLKQYGNQLAGNFVVVTETTVRMVKFKLEI